MPTRRGKRCVHGDSNAISGGRFRTLCESGDGEGAEAGGDREKDGIKSKKSQKASTHLFLKPKLTMLPARSPHRDVWVYREKLVDGVEAKFLHGGEVFFSALCWHKFGVSFGFAGLEKVRDMRESNQEEKESKNAAMARIRVDGEKHDRIYGWIEYKFSNYNQRGLNYGGWGFLQALREMYAMEARMQGADGSDRLSRKIQNMMPTG
ncbi:hypothetical protein B0H16DRAFT_1457393 [Mycena metata]|uniref:Uncharacterized protein n=1 Tax=Mycena metata TaxID=1033252 RepID=A0AAD7J6S8_9AGAR|nr:hypothetical protein B0H16DRAFT_1457393 [Mycena metata]